MSFERLKATTQTLRFRLMVWNAGVVLLTGIAILVGVREGLRLSLLSEMDQVLRQDLAEIALALDDEGLIEPDSLRDAMDRKAKGHKQDEWFVQFLTLAGNEIWSSENTPTDRGGAAELRDLQPASIGGHRMLQHPLSGRDGSTQLVRVGASLGFLARDMARIDRLVVIILGLMLVIAPLGGYWLAGRATRPLAGIIHTMAHLRPAKLDERLPQRNTGDELDQLSRTFNRLLDRIAAHVQEHRDSLANAAHELRTPLAAIRSSIEVSLNEERATDEYRELLANLIDECQSLETLVNQLLLLAETEADRLKIVGQFIDLHSVLERSVDMFRGVADFRHIALVLESSPEVLVEGSRHHLRQLLNNLIDNALKFTPAQGRVVVSLAADHQHNRAILQVRDSGFGISPDELPHIFERFYRGDRSRRRDHPARGTGLGLCICQSVVRAHGGTIDVESTPGVGTRFTVVLPLLNAESLAAARQQLPAAVE
jgi:signal transduction histidine kinase